MLLMGSELKILNGSKKNFGGYMIKGKLRNFKIIDGKSQFNHGKLENSLYVRTKIYLEY